MSDVRDIKQEAPEGRISWYARITRSAVDLADMVPVVIPEFDEHLEWGPCPWQSRDATSLPAAGDVCLVIFDNRRTPWIVAWWPF